MASDILSSNKMVLEALVEGGWAKKDEESSDESENIMVRHILNKSKAKKVSATKKDTVEAEENGEVDDADEGTNGTVAES